MQLFYKQADGRKIESRRVLAAVERGRTVPNWRPHLLGGGLGTTRVGGEEVIQRHSGRHDNVYIQFIHSWVVDQEIVSLFAVWNSFTLSKVYQPFEKYYVYLLEVSGTYLGQSDDRRTDYDHVESKHEKELHVERELDYEPDDHHGRYNQPGHGHRHADPEHDPDQYDHYEHQRGRGEYDEEDAHGDYNQPPDPDMIEDDHPTGEKSKSRDRDRNYDMDRDYHRSERSHPRVYDY
ncbi:hypothetical protein KIW84_031946 [Lathyrus oleraceus]|uniref:Uncharacterized protein n=1 Tax=Pisum sativum TaxID=3888 RepID=A0A9D5B1A7_PEA|nr:hypothetical protein KIW84_031946 [Pisum sativum]